mmetsp:Transcript_58891/g.108782  ORF Transcript_58891/g.108782 Transcript_58891/m.108782 type:complete len:560 (+) Transcript_58891:89-1768(+)
MAPPAGPAGADKAYTADTFKDVKSKAAGPSMGFLLALWALFVLNRAVHPLAIDFSKEATSGPSDKAGALKLGTRVSLKGIGDRYEGHRYLADVVSVGKDSVKVRYTDGGYRRFNKADFNDLLTELPPAGGRKYEVGMQVRLKGKGHRYKGHYYYADIVEITRTTVKVKYTDGGWKRFGRFEFQRLLSKMPDTEAGEYEVGMHVKLQGTGKWYAGSAYYVDIVEITDDTVKVRYADGMFKRMPKSSFEALYKDKGTAGVVREMKYRKMTPVLLKSFLCFILCDFMAMFDKDGWREGLRKCHQGPSVRLFAFIGVVYAIGDFLEMMSMGGMDGTFYQVLLQSKLVITALMMWMIKGDSAKQTRTQWAALVTVTLGMVIFMQTQSKGGGGGGFPAFSAIFMVLLKVIVSCYAAVMSDQSLKKYSNLPLHIQLSQLFLPWGLASIALAAFFEPAAIMSPSAFFAGWNSGTVLVMMSFAVKTVLTMTLLKILDSIAKNIGEAVAVLVIYVMQIVLPSFSKTFELDTFIGMSIVVMTVTTYMFLKKDLDTVKANAAKAVKDKSAV